MIPSRGFLRSASCLGLPRPAIPRTSPRISSELARSSVRQFGTALRSHASPLSSSLGRKWGGSGRIGGALAIPALATSNTILSSLRQARYASSQPEALASSASSSGTTPDPSTFADITDALSLSGSDLLNMPESIGFLKTLGLDFGWGTTTPIMWVMEHIYIYTGMPWWATLTAMAVLSRAFIVGPMLKAADNGQKMQELRKDPYYAQQYQKMRDAAQNGGDMKEAMEARRQLTAMSREAGINNWYMLAPFVPMVVMFGMFRIVRGMAALPVASMETGGCLWFPDLTIADPFFVLPVLSAGLMFWSMQTQIPHMAVESQKMMKMMSYVLVPLGGAITISFPAGLQFYLLLSSAMQALQTWLLYQPWFRSWMGFSPMSSPGTAAPTGRGSPFANHGGSWQAPRVVDTTATAKPAGMFSSLKKTVTDTVGKATDRMDKNAAKTRITQAKEYDERRALEDKQDYEARMMRKRASKSNDRR